jgi:hypothetical protein
MWGIIKKIKMFSRLEKGRLEEARSVLAPPHAPLKAFFVEETQIVRV